MGDVLTLLVLVLPLLGFWFLLVRPAQRRNREVALLRSSLQPGQEVITTSGLFGTIRAVEGEVVHLEVADGLVLRFVSGAIGTVVNPAEHLDDAPED
jgi:preprotein translocase subunit YajC